ncbi:MAG: chemotaxis protein CheA [Candidatus Magnetominusculus sp. LBB02]|nr:chemotaxis protein CheA [Candidatus Magnetominusculus sp. LBB02]
MADEIDESLEESINDFLIETAELIEDVNQKFVALESDRENHGLINGIFRSVHSIKGTAGFFGFDQVVQLAHMAENVLKKLSDGKILLTPAIMDVLLESVDMLRVLLDHVRSRDGVLEDLTEILSSLKGIYNEASQEIRAKEGVKEELAGIISSFKGVYEQAVQQKAPPAAVEPINENLSLEELERLMEERSRNMIKTGSLGEILVSEGEVTREDIDGALKAQGFIEELIDKGAPPKLGEILVATNKVSEERVNSALSKQSHTRKEPEPQADQTIRVDIEKLDNMLTLVGEMVLARNRLMNMVSNNEVKFADKNKSAKLAELTSFIDLITTDLQAAVMKTRMQPIKKQFSKFPRMVRDLARSMKKEVALTIMGEDTELDKTMLEEIGDPLVHLIRNSVDHGIEMPADREAAGKSRDGTVVLSAYKKDSFIIIQIEDDGKGIDVAMLKEKILEKGLSTMEELEKLSEKEVLDYIFLPGFSTAKVVSDVSGRGVGMDVVKTNITKLTGVISIETAKGRGTKFILKLPLTNAMTLAIIEVLMVGVGDEMFAIPVSSIVEIVSIDRSDIHTVTGSEALNLRNEIVPVQSLADVFSIHVDSSNSWSDVYVVVILIRGKKIGMIVDRLFGQEQVAIKPIKGFSKKLGVAGATITGDGEVVLILDLPILLDSNQPEPVMDKMAR